MIFKILNLIKDGFFDILNLGRHMNNIFVPFFHLPQPYFNKRLLSKHLSDCYQRLGSN